MNKDNEDLCIGFYEHQVGGHHCIISYKGYILKPYNDNEAFMYSHIPQKYPHLTPFLPEFYGIVHFADSEMKPLQSTTELTFGMLKDSSRIFNVVNQSESGSSSYNQREEWFKGLLLKRFNRDTTSDFVCDNIEFIKLRDLTEDKKFPCVLDVKIGLGRLKSGRVKVETTTESLKFRLCGMSVRFVNGSPMFKDKYWGRNVSIESMKQSLTLFFLSGRS